MTSKLIPSDPSSVMVIRSVSPSITTLSTPFSRFGLVKLGGRGTLVKLPSGSVAVFSPVALTPDVKATVERMGPVKYIAALDMEHHIFVGSWHNEYPDALVIGPEELKKKREGMKEMEKVRWDVLYHDKGSKKESGHSEDFSVDEEFDREFDRAYVPAHANKELVFNFKRERTLIQGDLMFNLPATEQYSKSSEDPHSGLLTRFFTKINGTGGGQINWQKRFIWYAISSGDRQGFSRSIKGIESWDFDRIIPCHGDVIESGGKGVFRNLFGWHLNEKSS